jgi:hypothetical protein
MKGITLATLVLLASVASCDSGCVRLFAPKANIAETEITAKLSPDSEGAEEFDHSGYATLLEEHVDYETARVDYSGLAEDEQALDSYLDALAEVDLSSLGADAQLAVLINAYNAFTLKLILEHYPDIESIKDISKPWDTARWTLGGAEISLNQLEHGLIRPIYKDSRIHFAVNCASIGCPPLAPWPYTGADLDAQLDKAARRTLQDDRYARVEDGEFQVTPLMNWYKPDFVSEDFEPTAETIPAYAAMYGDAEIRTFVASEERPGYSFLDYDWSLNDID